MNLITGYISIVLRIVLISTFAKILEFLSSLIEFQARGTYTINYSPAANRVCSRASSTHCLCSCPSQNSTVALVRPECTVDDWTVDLLSNVTSHYYDSLHSTIAKVDEHFRCCTQGQKHTVPGIELMTLKPCEQVRY